MVASASYPLEPSSGAVPIFTSIRVRLPPNVPVQRPAAQRTVRCNRLLAARAPVVHGDRAVAERLRRDQLEPSRAGQPALVQGRAVAGDPGMDEQFVLVDQIQPVQLGRELPLSRSTPSGVASLSFCTPVRRSPTMWWLLVHGKSFRVEDTTYFGFGLQLDRPLAQRRRCLHVAAGDRWPVALHHLVGDAAPQHRPALVHEAGEEGVCLIVGDSFLVVDAAVHGDVDTERSRVPWCPPFEIRNEPLAVWLQVHGPIREVLPLCRVTLRFSGWTRSGPSAAIGFYAASIYLSLGSLVFPVFWN